MVHAKNYECVSTLVKVMRTKNRGLFSGHGVLYTYRVFHKKQPLLFLAIMRIIAGQFT